jgi:hypothetical protein
MTSFSGLVVNMLASGNQDREFEPGRSRAVEIFRAKKSTACFNTGGEVKPSAPCCRFGAYKETPAIYVEVGIAGKIDQPFLSHNSILHQQRYLMSLNVEHLWR